jgi:hypothetical protein
MKHGTERYFIQGEGLVMGRLFPLRLIKWIFTVFFKPDDQPHYPSGGPEQEDDDDLDTMPVFKFCRILPKGQQPNGEDLVMLGKLMESETGDPADGGDSNIPGGYTYFGQFVDHDITRDKETQLTQDGMVDPGQMDNFRTPALDLDSLYGKGPDGSPELFEADGRKLRIGQTTDVGGLGVFPNDLPRLGPDAGPGQNATDAVIGDPRNDENLAVAQTHLAFLKFHNKRADASPEKSFEEIKRDVVLHYQAIVLTDFLPRVMQQDILQDVLENGRKFYTDTEKHKDCMPVEFSVAAYRMGHSMVRPSYEWNRIFNTNGPAGIATFKDLFEFSGGSGSRGSNDRPFRGEPTLPSNWIVDWRLMYEIPLEDGTFHSQRNRTRKLDERMALDLKTLPEFQQQSPQPPEAFWSLATRNLLRGRMLFLPTGQEAAAALGVTALTPEEILLGVPPDQANQLTQLGFTKTTPLWYYILREAMLHNDGNKLGVVGSRILAETFVGLIQNSGINVLEESPGLTFSMPDLLQEVDEINPLG